eukprot:CAMPEP_0183509064 /NCGR_PEP_ID=MMETSP0371-20130417/9324_1 /TAXON_ID=268820 /ORGANISM="Peridinium aciculiferum, Strain PAER-2" /LENGTH=62 /DNA_ID=CAMNT_0025705575 /DNA_START=1 /DNA_END=186 /DNA_ORIENTATION=+
MAASGGDDGSPPSAGLPLALLPPMPPLPDEVDAASPGGEVWLVSELCGADPSSGTAPPSSSP